MLSTFSLYKKTARCENNALLLYLFAGSGFRESQGIFQ